MQTGSLGEEQRQRVALAFSGAVQIGTLILMGTVVAVYIGKRASPFAVSVAASVYALSRILFAPVWGAIADITGRRRTVLLLVAALGTVASLPFLFVEDPWAVIAVRGLYGAFTAGLAPILYTLVSNQGGDTARGKSLGGFNSVRSIGFMLAQLTAGALLGILAPNDLFAVIVGLNLVMTLTIVLVTDTTPTPKRNPTFAELSAEVKGRLLPATGSRDHLTTNGLHWLYASLTLRHMTWSGIYSLLPVYFITVAGTSEWEMGLLLALAPGGEIVGMYVFGRLADIFGRKPLITYGLVGHVLMALLLAAASTQAAPLGMLVAGSGLLLKAAAFSALFVGSVTFIGDVAASDRESELMGVRSSATGLGGVIGPLLVGAAATLYGYRVAFVGASFIVLIGAILSARHLVESRPEETRAVGSVTNTED